MALSLSQTGNDALKDWLAQGYNW